MGKVEFQSPDKGKSKSKGPSHRTTYYLKYVRKIEYSNLHGIRLCENNGQLHKLQPTQHNTSFPGSRIDPSIDQLHDQHHERHVRSHAQRGQHHHHVTAGAKLLVVSPLGVRLGEELSIALLSPEEAGEQNPEPVRGEESADAVEFRRENSEHHQREREL